MTGERRDLAEDRTDLAEDRTGLAVERTFAGWLRTGLAAVGIGLGFQALFRSIEPIWVAKALATVFVLIGIFIFSGAQRRACRMFARLDTHQVDTAPPPRPADHGLCPLDRRDRPDRGATGVK